MIEIITEKSIYMHMRSYGDSKPHYRAQLIADTAEELSGVTEVGGNVLDFGSIALTADGKALMLDSSSTWHDLSDGSEVSGNG